MTEAYMCATCRFYGNRGYGLGPCLRYPPVVRSVPTGAKTEWPQVSSSNWCGEYQEFPA